MSHRTDNPGMKGIFTFPRTPEAAWWHFLATAKGPFPIFPKPRGGSLSPEAAFHRGALVIENESHFH